MFCVLQFRSDHWSSVLFRVKTDSRRFFKRNCFKTLKLGCYYNKGFFSIGHFFPSSCVLGLVFQIPRSSTFFYFTICFFCPFLRFCLKCCNFYLPDLSVCLCSCPQNSCSSRCLCSATLATLHRFPQPFIYQSLTLVIPAPGLPLRSCPKESPALSAHCWPVLRGTVLFFRMLLR